MRTGHTTTADLEIAAGEADRRGLLQAMSDAIARVWRAYLDRRTRLATLRVLHSMDDRMLKDIGIRRSEIHSVIYSEAGDRVRRFEKTWE